MYIDACYGSFVSLEIICNYITLLPVYVIRVYLRNYINDCTEGTADFKGFILIKFAPNRWSYKFNYYIK